MVPPIPLLPEDLDMDVDPGAVVFEWIQDPIPPDSFFDIIYDIDPEFPTPVVWENVGVQQLPENRFRFELYEHVTLMQDQVYYWFVRVRDTVQQISADSQTWLFGTYNGIPKSKIKGKTMHPAGYFVSGILVSCPGALGYQTMNSSMNDGSYQFTVANSTTVTYVVTPTPPTVIQYFSPSFNSYNNISSDQLNQDFTLYYYQPNLANFVSPADLAAGVSINTDQLIWSFNPEPGYSLPTHFDVYFPADNPAAIQVAYVGRDYSIPVGPLEYGTTYTWKVVPVNGDWEADGVEIWSFTTEDPPPNPLTLLSPLDGEINVAAEEVTLEFEHALWQVDSFFDIFVDMDPDFPEEPIYSDIMVPVSGTLLNHTIGPLMAEQIFYWKVRVTQDAEQWTSAVQQFSTTNYVVPTHSVSGTTYSPNGIASGSRKITYYANNVYAGSVNSSLNPPYGSYTINLPDITNVTYKVVPVKPTLIQYWSPTWRTYSNLTADQTGEDYYLNYLTPNPAIQPIPLNLANNVAINIGSLKWSYLQQPGYGTPLGFEVYFPATDVVPYAVVPYGGRDPEYEVVIPPLEYEYLYEWRVVPYNLDGPAEDVEIWTFETEPYPDPYFPPDLYIYPGDNDTGVEDAGLVMYWQLPEDEKNGYPVDSFFDVFCDIDPDFVGSEPIYSGPGLIDPYNPNGYYCYAPPLDLNTTYYWYIKLTLPSEEVHNSPTWSFTTTDIPIPHPYPILIYPPDLSDQIPPQDVPFVWDVPDYPAESFFDVFVSIDPDFPEPPIYTGPGTPLLPYVNRWFCSHPLLLPNQIYFWYVRLTNTLDMYYTKSGTATFTTGGYAPPEPPILWSPVQFEEDVLLFVPLKYKKPDQSTIPPESFFDVFFDVDPAFPDPPVYTGPGIPDPLDPELFICEVAGLQENQNYHWFVRYTDSQTNLSSDSEIRSFTTGNFIQSGIPEIIIPPPGVQIPGVIIHLDSSPTHYIDYQVEGLESYLLNGDFDDIPPLPANYDAIDEEYGFWFKFEMYDAAGNSGTDTIAIPFDTTEIGIEVSSDSEPTTWWIVYYFEGAWHPASDYPSWGYGPRLVYLNPPPGGKSALYILIVEGEGLDPTLPVELSSFDAVVTAEQFVNLTWVVQSETNLMGYYIMRNEEESLSDALTLNLTPITEGAALGTQVTYQYIDAQVEQNFTYYYWLNSVDLDGTTHFYGPVSVTITGADPNEPIPIIPIRTELLSAYPNPFNPSTTIPFNLKDAGDVKIEVYNNKGQLIWLYSEKGKAAGYHSVVWNGKDMNNREVSSGVYYYRMTCGKYTAGKKVVLLK